MSAHELTRVKIYNILKKSFNPSNLEVIDESSYHKGHAEALLHPSAGHFKVIMAADAFKNLSMVERHRMVYRAVADMMDEEIHALALSLSDK